MDWLRSLCHRFHPAGSAGGILTGNMGCASEPGSDRECLTGGLGDDRCWILKGGDCLGDVEKNETVRSSFVMPFTFLSRVPMPMHC